MTALILFAVWATAAAATAAVREAGLIDRPNHRSSHSNPTPRGGGLGVLTGFALALLWLVPGETETRPAYAVIALCGAGAACLGLLDDLFTLSEKLKFVVLVTLSWLLAAFAGPVTDLGLVLPYWLGLAGSALFVFTAVNAVNFMDGSDGLMAGSLAVASAGLALLSGGSLALLALAMAAAWLGFALFNAPVLGARGSVFAGDAGALGGAMLTSGLLLFWAAGAAPGSAFVAALLLLPLLGDVLLTMAARARAGRRLLTPHRAHAYQLLIRMEWSHRRVALVWSGLSAVAAGLAYIGHLLPAGGKAGMFVLGVLAFSLFHRQVRRMARAQGLDTTQ